MQWAIFMYLNSLFGLSDPFLVVCRRSDVKADVSSSVAVRCVKVNQDVWHFAGCGNVRKGYIRPCRQSRVNVLNNARLHSIGTCPIM